MSTITYLVANHDRGRYLEDCLRSLHEQTSPNWRCLLLDDASGDDSVSIAERWVSDRVSLLRNTVNLGYTRSLMRLVARAATEWVAILDADDALYPEATEALVDAAAADPCAGFLYSNYRLYDEGLSRAIGEGLSAAIPPKRTVLTHGWVGAIRAFRLSDYRRTSGFDPRLKYAEDRDLVFKMEEVTRLRYVDRVLYKYRQSPDSQSRDPRKRRIGLRSQRRAYRAALSRRGIRGRAKLGYLLVLYRDTLRHGPYPRWIRRAARHVPDGWKLIEGVPARQIPGARGF